MGTSDPAARAEATMKAPESALNQENDGQQTVVKYFKKGITREKILGWKSMVKSIYIHILRTGGSIYISSLSGYIHD